MKPATNADRQRQHYERMKAAGFKKACVYVPAKMVTRLNAYAARLRKEASR